MNDIVDGEELTDAEAEIWHLHLRTPDPSCLWIAEYIQIDGRLDLSNLEQAMRHEISQIASLNRIYSDSGSGPQKYAHSAEWDFDVYDLRDKIDAIAAAETCMRKTLNSSNDLSTGNVFRFAIFRIAEDCTLWFHSYHHIAMDGVGVRQVAARVAGTYTRLVDAHLMPLEQQNEARPLSTDLAMCNSLKSSHFWSELLEGWEGPIALGRKGNGPTAIAVVAPLNLSDEVTLELRKIARIAKVPLAHVLIASAAIWLNTASGMSDVVFGLAVRGRGIAFARTPATMTNIVPIRLMITEQSTLLTLAQEVALQRRNSRPYDLHRAPTLLRELGLSSAHGFGPIVNIVPVESQITFGVCRCVARTISIGPVSDLCVNFFERKDGRGLTAELAANPALYSSEEIRKFTDRFEHILVEVTSKPTQEARDFDFLSSFEREFITENSAGHIYPVPHVTISDLFASKVHDQPDALFITHNSVKMTYAEIHKRASQLVTKINMSFPFGTIAIVLSRSPEYFVALLAITGTGRPFAAIDPSNPPERINAMIEYSKACGIISSLLLRELLPKTAALLFVEESDHTAELTVDIRKPQSRPEDVAYVMFTSGTSGRPKAVAVPHRGIGSLAAHLVRQLGLEASSAILQFSSPGFDAVIMELLMALGSGGALRQPNDEERLGPALGSYMKRSGITHALLPPTALLGLDPEMQSNPGTLVVGGEACSMEQAARWAVGRKLVNAYGPTEATICSTMSDVLAPGDRPPIGRPIQNTRIYILDQLGRLTPPGSVGELYIAGDGVALGYLGDEAETSRSFLPCPFVQDELMFRTGDRVRFLADGSIDWIGRVDRQIKLRGIRVDPQEIEAAFGSVSCVQQAYVVGVPQDGGRTRLVAYIVPKPGVQIDRRRLLTELALYLPRAMLPSVLITLKQLPLNPAGKIDHLRLPSPEYESQELYSTIATSGELALKLLFMEALECDQIDIEDDFFASGGDSLAATVLIHHINVAFESSLTIADLFTHPTVAAIGELLANKGAPTISPFSVMLGLRVGTDKPALFCMHTGSGLGWAYSSLLPYLDPAQPVYALQARGLDGRTSIANDFDAMVEDYVDAIRLVQPFGPYYLLGWSSGGAIAHRAAIRLQALGEHVGLLASLDGYPAGRFYEASVLEPNQREAATHDLRRAIEFYLSASPIKHLKRVDILSDDALERMIDIHINVGAILSKQRAGIYNGDLLIFTCKEPYTPTPMPEPDVWQPFISGRIESIELDCHHDAMLLPDTASVIGRILSQNLR